MARINRDIVAAVVLLVVAAGAFVKTFDIRTRNDGIMRADVWPQIIIAALAILSVIYLVQSLRAASSTDESGAPPGGPPTGSGLSGWFAYYANPLICFALYFAFLATLPWLGVLIGGSILVFLILSVLGGWEPRKLGLHAAISIGSIGLMWAIFTYALRVALPEGEILPLFLPR